MIEIRARIAGPFFAVNGIPAPIADPALGAISVPRARTVVVLPAPFGSGVISYIESNLAFMGEHRNNVIAMIEIARGAEGRHIFYGDTDVVDAVRALEHVLSGFQTAGQFRPDFDPHAMAIAIRAAIEAGLA